MARSARSGGARTRSRAHRARQRRRSMAAHMAGPAPDASITRKARSIAFSIASAAIPARYSNYSHAAADVILPHVIGDRRGLRTDHTPWSIIAAHSKLIVMFGGTAHKNAQVSSGGISAHTLRESLGAARPPAPNSVSISPIRDDTLAAFAPQWLRAASEHRRRADARHRAYADFGKPLRPRLPRALYVRLRALPALIVMGAGDGTPKTAEWASQSRRFPPTTIRALARRMAARAPSS